MTFQTVEQLQATVAEQALEIKRLTGCLAKANANHEHFEREWYLSGDQIASLTAENKRLRALLKRWSNYDDLDRIMGGVEAYEKLSADTGNALQPKEGE